MLSNEIPSLRLNQAALEFCYNLHPWAKQPSNFATTDYGAINFWVSTKVVIKLAINIVFAKLNFHYAY